MGTKYRAIKGHPKHKTAITELKIHGKYFFENQNAYTNIINDVAVDEGSNAGEDKKRPALDSNKM